MESILELMNDEATIGTLEDGTPLGIYRDNAAIFPLPFIMKEQKRPVYNELDFETDLKEDFYDDLDRRIEEFRLSHPNMINTNMDEREKAMNEACILLDQCRFHKTADREKLEKAVNLIEEYQLTNMYILPRSLVYFPDLLERFLKVQKNHKIADDDLASMLARCVEHREEDAFQYESIKHLVNYVKGQELKGQGLKEQRLKSQGLEIKLLPNNYPIDTELYEYLCQHNIRDSYYDASWIGEKFPYNYPDIVEQENSGKYVGYRDAYHCLLYGESKHLQSLIVRWDLFGEDCTTDAARDFFSLPKECPIEVVKEHINRMS